MRIGLLIIAVFWFLPVSSETLRIMGSDEGFLPFYYGKNLNKGILVEVIHEFSQQTGIEANFRPMPRKRQAWALKEGNQRGFRQPAMDAAARADARRRPRVDLA